jgi:thiol-disulfide isomerase/thioredoxin
MKNLLPPIVAALLLGLSAGSDAAPDASALSGVWSATADVGGAPIPFRLDLRESGAAVRAHFFDGERATTPSSEGTFANGKLHLSFPSYGAVIDATVIDGHLEGVYATPTRSIAIHAARNVPTAAPTGPVPAIGGEWIIPIRSDKGENAWRLIVKQTGGGAEAAILRVDGDTGTLSGRYEHGVFRLSHFAGERPALLEIAALPDHSLKLVLHDGSGAHELIAVKQDVAVRQGVAPTDPTRQTTVRNSAEPFRFAFRDLSGKEVTNADARFRHKVVVVDVMGSWCPNCHDEAPYLQALYAKHHKDGLEVVALDFEQRPDQVADPSRLRAFIARYGLTYTVLLAGETKDVNAKLPQAVQLNAWPTTFFIGRDGLVKATHVGFTSPGSGPRDVETRREVERQVEALLARKS